MMRSIVLKRFDLFIKLFFAGFIKLLQEVKSLNIIIPDYVKKAMQMLLDKGFQAYAVGGCIRDTLLDKQPNDWDVCTDCLPERIKEVFNDFRTIDTGIKHGTVSVMVDSEIVEITTFRSEGEYENHRRPLNVDFVSDLKEDIKRRDFTVNAMCCDINSDIYDFYNGIDDLNNGIIRCVGIPDERFEEDALRILRGLRFASVLGFEIDESTKNAMLKKKDLLNFISGERIRAELLKLLCGKNVENILNEYRDIFAVIIPEIQPCFDFEQNNPHHCLTVWEHIAKSVASVRPDPIIRMTMLLHDIGKPQMKTVDENGIYHFKKHQYIGAEMSKEILKRLKFDNRAADYIYHLIWEHDNRIPVKIKDIKKFISKYDFHFIFDYLEVRRGDTYAQSEYKRAEKLKELDDIAVIAFDILSSDACLKISDLKIRGNDLIELGLSGKAIGDWLNKLLDMVIEEKIENQKDILLNYIKENI